MTGKITVGTIQDTDGNTIASTYVTSGSAKAYIDIPYGQASINKSLNVSTLTDSGAGDGVVNFTNSFDGTGYAIATACNDNSSVTSIIYAHDITHGTQLASSYNFETVYWNASNNRTNGDIRSHSQLVGDLA